MARRLLSEGLKTCSKCNVQKPVEAFGRSSGGRYLRPECRDCVNELTRQRMYLKKQYGQPPPGYLCEGCHTDNPGRNSATWCIDHDHKTGKFKSWLCHDCNLAIGICKDDPDIMERLAKYTRRHADGSERETEG